MDQTTVRISKRLKQVVKIYIGVEDLKKIYTERKEVDSSRENLQVNIHGRM